ncbi:MAG: imidazole glycerol phosphate synthase, glutamine amidotransferase subunit [Acidobacteriaceae bacterium]|nr:imidazole glycerol phosphate synthase, glutamine amidotransferase subunit [Acidobacteriaceae bacterium]
MTIAIIDYGVGNLASVKKAMDHIDADSTITSDPKVVSHAEKIVLPGVGHFSATSSLDRSGLRDAVSESIKRGVPFLGICVGMQWMIDSSQEASGVRGLGLWPGECERFPASVKSPHVGWNQLELRNGSSRLLREISSGSFVYFTHSFRLPLLKTTVAECEYGGRFSAVVEQDNLFGVQFHPEKSGPIGLQLLRNFCSL